MTNLTRKTNTSNKLSFQPTINCYQHFPTSEVSVTLYFYCSVSNYPLVNHQRADDIIASLLKSYDRYIIPTNNSKVLTTVQADTQGEINVEKMLLKHDHVVTTLFQRKFDLVCSLGSTS